MLKYLQGNIQEEFSDHRICQHIGDMKNKLTLLAYAPINVFPQKGEGKIAPSEFDNS